MIPIVAGFIIGVLAGWFITAVTMAYHAQQGYVFYSDGRRAKWTHRQKLERGLWTLKQ